MRYFEDFAVGQTFNLGSRKLEADEIVAFAREYDPQPFHTDERAAAATPFGGLIASGWHTAAVFMRLYCDGLLNDTASLGAPGVDELRWLHPVRPGDTLTGSLTVLETRPSSTRPNRGTILLGCSLTNQDGVEVLTMRARGLFGRRP